MPHRFMMDDGTFWCVERRFDKGYLGDGTKVDHYRMGRRLIEAVKRTGQTRGIIRHNHEDYNIFKEEGK